MRAKDADTTWGLVVGIDTYDHVRHLTGAAADAVAAATWLRRAGVSDERILFHAAPSAANKAAVELLGLPVRGCTHPEIWQSFKALRSNSGKRLYVFLMGHGLYEPGGKSLFLTQEAEDGEWQNLGIDWYTAYLRSLDYTLQLVVTDGCLNLPYDSAQRAVIEPGHPSSVPEPAPRRDVMQLLCSGASAGDLAQERDGRGVFTATLLGAVDLDRPHPQGVTVDLEHGLLQLDAMRILKCIIKPTFSDLKLAQRPDFKKLDDGPTPDVWPFAELVPDGTSEVSVRVDPGTAVEGVQRITVLSYDYDFRLQLPTPPAPNVPARFQAVLPSGLALAANCAVKPGWTGAPASTQNFTSDADHEVVFTITRTPPPESSDILVSHVTQEASIEMLGGDGAPVSGLSTQTRELLERTLDEQDLGAAGEGISIHPTDLGAILTAGADDVHLLSAIGENLATLLTAQISQTTHRDIDDAVTVRTRVRRLIQPFTIDEPSGADERAVSHLGHGVGQHQATTGLRVGITARSAVELAGVLQKEPIFEVGPFTLTLEELLDDPFVPLEAGPWTVQIVLPWGSWNQRVTVVEGEQTQLELPRKVGRRPLRVKALRAPRGDRMADFARVSGDLRLDRAVLTLTDAAQPTLEEDPGMDAGAGGPSQVFSRHAAPAPWRGVLWQPPEPRQGPAWTRRARLQLRGRVLVTSLSEIGPVGVRLSAPYTAEPLSVVPSPHWDTLVATGQLGSLTPDAMFELATAKWSDPLLGVAAAYSCFVQGDDDRLRPILDNLEAVAPGIPDVVLLRAALDGRRGEHDPETRGRLERLGTATTPLFRWGVAIGAVGASHYGLSDLTTALESFAPRVVASSIWTLWEQPVSVRRPDPAGQPT